MAQKALKSTEKTPSSTLIEPTETQESRGQEVIALRLIDGSVRIAGLNEVADATD
jgi:hypothetical protein